MHRRHGGSPGTPLESLLTRQLISSARVGNRHDLQVTSGLTRSAAHAGSRNPLLGLWYRRRCHHAWDGFQTPRGEERGDAAFEYDEGLG